MPRMQKFILKACLAITSGLSTQTLAEDGVPFETAKAIGQRVAWTVPLPGGEVRHAEQLGNQLYVLDEQNFLSSLNLQSGRIMWSVQVTGAESTPDFIHTFEMRRGQGLAAKVTPMVLVGLGSELLKFDGTNGAMTKRVSMDRLPDTNPIEVGKYMVFGTNRGVVQWYNPDLEVPWRAFDCGDAMACDVSAGGDLLVAAARDGGVLCLQSGNGALIWRKKLLGPATGPAAIPATRCTSPPPTVTSAATTISTLRWHGNASLKGLMADQSLPKKTVMSPFPARDCTRLWPLPAMNLAACCLGSRKKQTVKSSLTTAAHCCFTMPKMLSSGWSVEKMAA